MATTQLSTGLYSRPQLVDTYATSAVNVKCQYVKHAMLNFMYRVLHAPRTPTTLQTEVDVLSFHSEVGIIGNVPPQLQFQEIRFKQPLVLPNETLRRRVKGAFWWVTACQMYHWLCSPTGIPFCMPRVCNLSLVVAPNGLAHLTNDALYAQICCRTQRLAQKCRNRKNSTDLLDAVARVMLSVAPYHPEFANFCMVVRMHSSSDWWRFTMYCIPTMNPYYAHFFSNCDCHADVDDFFNMPCTLGFSAFRFPAERYAFQFPQTLEMVEAEMQAEQERSGIHPVFFDLTQESGLEASGFCDEEWIIDLTVDDSGRRKKARR